MSSLIQLETLLIFTTGIVASVIFYLFSTQLVLWIYRYADLSIGTKETAGMFRDAITFSSIALTVELSISAILSGLNEYLAFTESVFLTLAVIAWARPTYNLGLTFIKQVIEPRYNSEIIPIIQNIWVLSLASVTILFVFEVWDVDITPLLASAGVLGIVLGLAARETISNFFGSVALYADDTYQIGDYIEVEGESGFVSDISIRSTQLSTIGGNIVTIPNSKLHNSIIKNKDTPSSSYRIKLEIGVSYDVPPNKSRQIIEETVEDCISKSGRAGNIVSSDMRKSEVFLDGFGDSSVKFIILTWVESPAEELRARDVIFDEVQENLSKNGIEIPYPQRSVHIEDEKE